MSEQLPKGTELKEYADGWITEKKGTDVPGFLKLAFPIIGLGATAYITLQMYGDASHATRGTLVQQFNTVSKTNPALVYTVTAMALVYVVLLVAFAIRKFHED